MGEVKIGKILDVKGQVPQAEALYAWISVDGDQFEGIIAGVNPPLPFVSMTEGNLRAWLPQIKDIVARTGKKARLIKFDRGEILEEVG